LKYPFRKTIYFVAPLDKWGKHWWTVKTAEMTQDEKGEPKLIYRVHFPLFKTEGEAYEYYKKMHKYTLLSSGTSSNKLRAYYGCNYCADALNKKLQEPQGDCKNEAILCIHKTCPYAKEIEDAGGFIQMVKETKNGVLFNLNF